MGQRTLSAVSAGIRDLFPGYFAFVMATGIISIAAHLLKMELISQVLFGINKAAYGLLWLMIILRMLFYRQQILDDLNDPMRSAGFYTLVAGSGVLGSQFILLSANYTIASALWVIALILWALLIYTLLTLLIVKTTKAGMEKTVNGAWFITVVATQSVSVLGTLIASHVGELKEVLLSFTLAMFLLGGILYILIAGFVLYRLIFFPLEPAQLSPTYWVSMGAMAISTLAGATLTLNAGQWSFLTELLPYIKGTSLFFWATATWWIPLLVVLGAWRHWTRRFPFQYEPAYWSLVFPLGMYTVCTFQLAKGLGVDFLTVIPRYFVYAAYAAWILTFAGLVKRIGSNLITRREAEPN